MNWNFNVQHELTPSMILQVAYVANHGVKLYSVYRYQPGESAV